jgi:DNA-binding SARP family transcriptional activator
LGGGIGIPKRSNPGIGPPDPLPGSDDPQGLSLGLLRGFTLADHGQRVMLCPSEQRLLALVALHGPPARRTWTAGVLWPDAKEHQASANLRSTLWRLGRRDGQLVEATRSHIWLSNEVRVDVRALEATAHRLLDPSREVTDADVDALCSSGDLLPDWYEDWVQAEREHLRQLRLRTLEVVFETLMVTGRLRQAVQTSFAAVETEPLRESAQRMLIRAYLAEGNRWVARRHYEAFRQFLGRELGVEPTAETRALVFG